MGGTALSLPSITLIIPPIFFDISENKNTPSAPPLQKIFPLVCLITSVSNRFFPPEFCSLHYPVGNFGEISEIFGIFSFN